MLIKKSLVLFVFLLVSIFSCSKNEKINFKREYFQAPQAKYSSWEDVFKNPSEIALTTFDTGKMMIPIGGVINLKHSAAKDIKKEKIKVPVLANLVQHEKYGYYLIDAGLEAAFSKKRGGEFKGIIRNFILPEIIQETVNDIASELNKRNIKLKGIFFTHLHFDHAASVIDLPKNMMYAAGKDENYINIWPFFYGNHLKELKTLYEIDFTNGIKMSPFELCVDIFGDGSLWAISTPGHTKGHTSYLINGIDGAVLVTGDACFHTLSIETGVGPGWYSSDIEEAQKSFDMILEFHKKYPDVKLVFGHEMSKG